MKQLRWMGVKIKSSRSAVVMVVLVIDEVMIQVSGICVYVLVL